MVQSERGKRRIEALTLQFDDPVLEQRYRESLRPFRHAVMRMLSLAGSALWIIFTLLNALTIHDGSEALLAVRLVAIFGTTITPYLFFWQASQEVEEELQMGRSTLAQRQGATDVELKIAEIDVDAGMIFASVVFYFVVLASAVTLHAEGKTDIQTATDAAAALRPLSHGLATILFACGLIGSGFLAVPVLTGSSAYAICDAFEWRAGLDEKFHGARRFYLIIAASTLVGLLVAFLKIPPVTALFWTAVINGVLAPPLIVLIMLVSNNRKVMGKRTNGALTNILGWLTAAIMIAAAVGMFLTWGK